MDDVKIARWDDPPEHRGMDWPPGGENPFDHRVDWAGRLYWAHEQPSRLFPAEEMPSGQELVRGVPMGYTMLTLLDRVALVHAGLTRTWEHDERHAQTPLQPYQLIVPPTSDRRYLCLGASWPVRWAVQQAQALSDSFGSSVLVCRVRTFENWH